MASKKKTTPKKEKKKSWVKGATLSLTLTEKMIEQAAELSTKGLFAKQIAAQMGVPYVTYKSWIERGREEISECESGHRSQDKMSLKAILVLALDKADSDLALGVHTSIVDCSDPQTTRANELKLKLLKLRHPRDYTELRTEEEESNNIGETAKDELKEKLAILLGITK